jgi:hypothetical protein
MDISSMKVLDKMEGLIKKAKETDAGEKRSGYITAIQAMCELLLEDTGTDSYKASINNHTPTITPYNPVQQPSISSMPQTKPVKMEDANGDSLFDF